MFDLQIFDVSALVHEGAKSPYLGERNWYNYPVGGILNTMRYLSVALAYNDSIIACFDSPSFRNNLNNGYKGGRTKDYAVISQLETLWEGLSACGVTCLKKAGYEADDLIDWAAEQCAPNFASTTIVGNDADLCHSVTRTVSFQSIAAKSAVSVNAANFEKSFGALPIPYNTISASKVFCGCPSDKIPVFKSQTKIPATELYQAYCAQLRNSGLIGKDASKDRQWLDAFVDLEFFPEEDKVELRRRIKLVYPAPCPKDFVIKPSSWNMIDKKQMAVFLSMYNDNDSLSTLKIRKVALTATMTDEIRQKAKGLYTGEFAADKNIRREAPVVHSSMLDLDSFSKEF